MRKPNWKQRGFASFKDKCAREQIKQATRRRAEKLAMLPPEVRGEIEKHPQLINLI